MQGQMVAPEPEGTGFPELNELGRRLEVLRIQRGISKQHLARFAGTSRQQLWRVMTGKSELTSSLRERLAQALGVAPGELAGVPSEPTDARFIAPAPGERPAALADYLADPAHLLRTLASLPGGADGLRLKRQLLNSLEDAALERSLALPACFFEMRRQVVAGEI